MLQINKLKHITNWLHNKGWRFYKHQLEVLEYSVKNFDILLIAPTGGGKTLGGFLPSIYDLSFKKKEYLLARDLPSLERKFQDTIKFFLMEKKLP